MTILKSAICETHIQFWRIFWHQQLNTEQHKPVKWKQAWKYSAAITALCELLYHSLNSKRPGAPVKKQCYKLDFLIWLCVPLSCRLCRLIFFSRFLSIDSTCYHGEGCYLLHLQCWRIVFVGCPQLYSGLEAHSQLTSTDQLEAVTSTQYLTDKGHILHGLLEMKLDKNAVRSSVHCR